LSHASPLRFTAPQPHIHRSLHKLTNLQGALTSPSTWNITAFLAGDTLAAEVANNTATRNTFFFSHHTWSHQNLDNATLYDAQVQIQLNKRLAQAVRRAGGLRG
jgi:hypothetical protein